MVVQSDYPQNTSHDSNLLLYDLHIKLINISVSKFSPKTLAIANMA